MAIKDIDTLKGKFSDDKEPNGADFGDIFDSYFHKSTRLPQSQVLGLNDELNARATNNRVDSLENTVNQKADRSELDNLIGGMLPQGEVATTNDLPTDPETVKRGYSYIVTNEKDPESGLSYIYVAEIVTDANDVKTVTWKNTKLTAYPADVAVTGGSEIKSMRQMDDIKADKAMVETAIKSIQNGLFIWMYNSAAQDAESQISYYPVVTGKQYRITGQVSSPLNNNPSGIGAYGFYTNNVYANGIDGTVVRQASNAATHNMVQYELLITAPEGANYFGVTQRVGVDSFQVLEVIDVLEVKSESDKNTADIGQVKISLTSVETTTDKILASMQEETAVKSVQNGLYIWTYNSAAVDAELQIAYYPVVAGKLYRIKGQVSSPLNNTPNGIGAYGFYTNNAYANGIDGTVVRQASNAATHNMVQYELLITAPEGANYFGVTQRVGVDSFQVLGQISIADLKQRVDNIDPNNTVRIDGDSISWGSAASAVDKCYSAILRALIQANGYSNNVINCGIGGESFANIPVRQGGVGFYLADDTILPALSSQKIEIQRTVNWVNNQRFKNTYHGDDSYFSLLVQGETGRDNTDIKTVNPIIVNGVECTMSLVGTASDNIIYLNRNTDADNGMLIKSGTFLYPNGVRIKCGVSILSVGTNGGFIVKNNGVLDLQASIQQYIEITDLMLEYAGVSKYVICSPYGGTALNELGVNGLIELEKALTKRYGNKHFNWRKYFVEEGLSDAGIDPTQEDYDAITAGKVPPSLLSDGLHPNDAGHRIIGIRLYKMLLAMGALTLNTNE